MRLNFAEVVERENRWSLLCVEAPVGFSARLRVALVVRASLSTACVHVEKKVSWERERRKMEASVVLDCGRRSGPLIPYFTVEEFLAAKKR
jgi:hypothetical protein